MTRAVTNHASNDISVLLGDGTGSFGAATNFYAGLYPYNIAVEDLNADGKSDLLAKTSSNGYISVLFGNGKGNFSTPDFYVESDVGYAAFGDFNKDGKTDIAMTNYSFNNVSVLLNTTTV